jgi:hypothetical protein
MKERFKYRKQWEAIAKEIGIQDVTSHVVVSELDPSTGKNKESMRLINNFNRFVKGMCAIPLAEQELKLVEFRSKMTEVKEDNERLRQELDAEQIKIQNESGPKDPHAI